MKREMARAVADEIDDRSDVLDAFVDENDKGVHVKAHVTEDNEQSLKSDLHQYPVYIMVIVE